jgi:hypothetical protein
LETKADAEGSGSKIAYAITGCQIAGSITLVWEPAVGRARFEYADPIEDLSENATARRFLIAVKAGAAFQIATDSDEGEILLNWPRMS